MAGVRAEARPPHGQQLLQYGVDGYLLLASDMASTRWSEELMMTPGDPVEQLPSCLRRSRKGTTKGGVPDLLKKHKKWASGVLGWAKLTRVNRVAVDGHTARIGSVVAPFPTLHLYVAI